MPMKYIFSQFMWKGDPYQPFISLVQIDGKQMEEKYLKIGENFNIRIHEGKFCIGTEVERGRWITCVESKERLKKSLSTTKIRTNKKQCTLCTKTNFFDCRMTCVGNYCNPTTPRAKKICDPPDTSVYITNLAGINKVGVSLSLPRRWIEQGSSVGIRVAKLPGLEARRLEQKLAKAFDLKLQVRNSTKIKQLSLNVGKKERDKLLKIAEKSSSTIDSVLATSTGEKYTNANLVDLEEYYGNSLPNKQVTEIKVQEGVEFGGEIFSIRGSILIVKRGEYFYALDLKQLLSRVIEFTESTEMDTHTSLDEWF